MNPLLRACARLVALRTLTFVCVLAAALALIKTAWAGPVSATPGVYTGVITFNAPFVPTSIEVDARDSSNQYSATAEAAQNDPVNCPAGSQLWCYSITVESALANNYYLRPIAYQSVTTPFYLANRVPFPPTALVPITPSATVTWDISYQPGEISGAFTGNDLNGNPLQVNDVYMSFDDLSNTFDEPCGGSIEFCPFNSVYQGGAVPLPGQATYQTFLKPSDSYNYLTRAVGFQEPGGATTNIQFNGNQPLSATPPAGVNLTQNYALNQTASVSGSISAPGQSVYNYSVTVIGNTLGGGAFYEDYGPSGISSTPLTQPLSYTGRIFNFTDFTQPIYVQPLLTLSTDGTTSLEYPATLVTPALTSGSQGVLNFNSTAASIAGSVTFNPPYPVGNIYPGVQAEIQTPSGAIGSAESLLTATPTGGTYTIPAFGGDWQYWRFGWNFILPNPNFTSNYLVDQFLTQPVTVADGQNLTGNNFTFSTALVKVFFTAPQGDTFTNPQLSATTGSYTNNTFVADYAETGQAAGLGFTSVTQAESDIVLRVHNVPFEITPSAIINTAAGPGTGSTDFSPIVLNPNPGDVIIVGVPGTLSLTVNAPQDGQTFQTCQIPVSGSATGTQNITITVNGESVMTTSAANPNDANQVLFSTTITGSGSTPINVTASAPGNSSVTDTLTVTANCASTTTTATSAPNPSVYGQLVTFTANVTSSNSGNTPTGNVTFTDASGTIGSGTLNSGVATYSTSALDAGTYTVTASYGGDSNNPASVSGTFTQIVDPAPQTIVFTGLPATAVYGAAGPYMLNATGGASGNPVTYTVTGPASISGSTLTISGSGTVVVTASQAGNANYSAATPVSQTVVVSPASSITTLVAVTTTPKVGQSDLLTATVSGAGQQPGGTVVFKAGTTVLCTTALNAGVATCNYVPSATGGAQVTAQYLGDQNHTGSSATLTLKVVAACNDEVILTVDLCDLHSSDKVSGQVCVKSSGKTPATGSVKLLDGATVIATVTLGPNGCAKWQSNSALSVGTHILTAVYSGDKNNPAGTSNPVTVTVRQIPVKLNANCGNSRVNHGSDISYQVSVNEQAGPARGSITYSLDGGAPVTLPLNNGATEINIAKPAIGTHTVVIGFPQQGNYAAGAPQTQQFTITSSGK